MFTPENTTGYSTIELDALNIEWGVRAEQLGLSDPDDAEYIDAEKAFADEVSRR